MLNPNAQKWVAALRSGKFKQCQKRLVDGGAFCCLGVACVVASENGVVLPHGWAQESTLCSLARVQDWLGIQSGFGIYDEAGLHRELTIDNDSGKTFSEIADIIESEPEGLFVKEVAQ